MVNPISGGGNKFQSANNFLERPVAQLGRGPQMAGAPIRSGEGNIPVAGLGPDVAYASIAKGDGAGVRGAAPIRLMGGTSPFGAPMGTPGMGGSFSPMPQPMPMPQPQAAPAPAPAPHMSLGANEEVHTLVARLQGPSGQIYEAPYEVVVPERGSRVLGVSERQTR